MRALAWYVAVLMAAAVVAVGQPPPAAERPRVELDEVQALQAQALEDAGFREAKAAAIAEAAAAIAVRLGEARPPEDVAELREKLKKLSEKVEDLESGKVGYPQTATEWTAVFAGVAALVGVFGLGVRFLGRRR